MHKCWLNEATPLVPGALATLSAEESAHVARVLRMKTGDPVGLIAAERLYSGALVAVTDKATTVRVERELPSPECPVRVTLVQGLPKLDKLDTIIQKATELGVWDVMPVPMERSIAKLEGRDDQKRERWNRIALEAAKQSGRAHVPAIRPFGRLPEAVAVLRESAPDAVLIAWEEENQLRLSQAMGQLLADRPNLRSVVVVIGPEGGISAKEIELLSLPEARRVTLGKRILRTETAGLCALAVVMGALGEL